MKFRRRRYCQWSTVARDYASLPPKSMSLRACFSTTGCCIITASRSTIAIRRRIYWTLRWSLDIDEDADASSAAFRWRLPSLQNWNDRDGSPLLSGSMRLCMLRQASERHNSFPELSALSIALLQAARCRTEMQTYGGGGRPLYNFRLQLFCHVWELCLFTTHLRIVRLNILSVPQHGPRGCNSESDDS